MNKKGMIAKLISPIIMIIIGISLYGSISQEVYNAINCNYTNNNSEYYGKTDSFGGGGSEHFGGYDGKVKTKPFASNLAIIKTNSSVFNSDCKQIFEGSMSYIVMSMLPILFIIGVLFGAFFMIFPALRDSGLI